MEKERKKNGEMRGWREKLCQGLDLMPDVFSGESLLEIRAARLLTLRGGGRILMYTPEQIEIALKRGRVLIVGESLVCLAYHADAIEIEGKIRSIGFEEER